MKQINVMLTKFSDLGSLFLYIACGFGYTHASIGLAETPGVYYSFNTKGFCEETIPKYRRHGVKKSICYQLNVSDEAYAVVKNYLEEFKQTRKNYQYTMLGTFLCHFHIRYKRSDRYFCSQFVADLLIRSGAVRLKKIAELYLPNQFRKELEQHRQLNHILYNPVTA